ncbi:MAG: deoxyribodipyrimidine photo-lyase [Gemmataceae bacterium]
MCSGTTIVWLRHDLRLADNPALESACQGGGPVVPVFIWAPEEEGKWVPGAASRWWLHQSLEALDESLRQLSSRLIIRKGPTHAVLDEVARETGAERLVWNRRYEPAVIERDQTLKSHFRSLGLEVESFNSALLFEPWQVATKTGRPFQVYTPFWKACCATKPAPRPLPTPTRIPAPEAWPTSLALNALALEPKINWAAGMRETWQPGEVGATERLQAFIDDHLNDYADERDFPGADGTSSLSPHLHFGEVSPRTMWYAVLDAQGKSDPQDLPRGSQVYLKEVVWREFAYQLLYHFSHTTDEPLRSQYTAFPWRSDPTALRAWQRGKTGYPFVDAGMRQLWTTGWMHNRVRMVVASFLVKHLLLPWQDGARWFWDTLVDADLASNTLGWQWTAGCGADAAPYFRIFNPITQGEKFDPLGDYVRRWVPELARLPTEVIHQPWTADDRTLGQAGVTLGVTYPYPIVDHAEARARALQALESLPRITL